MKKAELVKVVTDTITAVMNSDANTKSGVDIVGPNDVGLNPQYAIRCFWMAGSLVMAIGGYGVQMPLYVLSHLLPEHNTLDELFVKPSKVADDLADIMKQYYSPLHDAYVVEYKEW
jgi:hypothetical protein